VAECAAVDAGPGFGCGGSLIGVATDLLRLLDPIISAMTNPVTRPMRIPCRPSIMPPRAAQIMGRNQRTVKPLPQLSTSVIQFAGPDRVAAVADVRRASSKTRRARAMPRKTEVGVRIPPGTRVKRIDVRNAGLHLFFPLCPLKLRRATNRI
jgi:hypothetical protein